MILLSIIIPTFKPSQLIRKCIKSVYEQKLDQNLIEVILIDDNSGKNSNIIFIKNNFKNLRLLKNNKNLGPGISRNIGIRKSKGKYVLFLDSDDFLKKNSLSKIMDVVKSKNVDVIFFDYCLIKNHRRHYFSNYYKFKYSNNEMLTLLLSASADTSAIFSLYKKKLLTKNKIYFKKGLHEDILFMFKIFFYSKSKFHLNDYLYRKVNFEKSIVNTISTKRIIDYFKAFNDIKNFADKNIDFKLDFEKKILSGKFGYSYEMINFIISRKFSYKKSLFLLNFIYSHINLFFNLKNENTKTFKDRFVSFFLNNFPQIKKKLDYYRFKRDILLINEKI